LGIPDRQTCHADSVINQQAHNLVEGFFSKKARSILRRIRVASKAELKQRILAYINELNREPVVHTWAYRITTPA
jgi:hypothetical protein